MAQSNSKRMSTSAVEASIAAFRLPESAPVSRRRVFHITGYDGRPAEATYGLFRREFIRRMERTGETACLSEPRSDDLGMHWSVHFGEPGHGVDVAYTLLRWDDIVRLDRERPWGSRAAAAMATLYATLRSGAFKRFARANPWFASVWIGPYAVCAAAPALGAAVGAIALLAFGAGWGISLLVFLIVTAALAWVATSLRAETLFDLTSLPSPASLGRIGQLFDLWSFARAYAERRCRALDRRLDLFAERVLTAIQEGSCDEILIIGHSMGAVLAVDVLDRIGVLMRAEEAPKETQLALLTLGALHELPAAYPDSAWLKKKIFRVAQSKSLYWLEYGDAGDPLNFPFGDFMERLGVERRSGAGNPHLRAANFSGTLSDATLRRTRAHLFRMHFRYVMTKERENGYDFFDFLCSSNSTSEWTRGCDHT